MSGTSFDRITQEVLKQQQLMQKLAGENRELRRELADLRAGRGIFVEIVGQRFPLEGEMLLPQPVTTSTIAQEDLPQPRTTSSLQETPAPIVTEDKEVEEAVPVAEGIFSEAVEVASLEEEETGKQQTPTFLEEIMLDEFAAAATSPIAVWSGPVKMPEVEPIDEVQKAALRRELMGSFLLE